MQTITRRSGQWLLGALATICATGCRSSALTIPGGDGAVPPSQYVFDFSAAEVGGVFAGRGYNLAVSFDSRRPVRKFVFDSATTDIQIAGLVAGVDFGVCNGGGSLEVAKDRLPGIDRVWADFVDVEMLTTVSVGTGPTVCSGYRDPAGAWHWNFKRTPFALDPAAKRLKARVEIKQGPLDALKLVVGAVQPVPVTRITVTTLPQH